MFIEQKRKANYKKDYFCFMILVTGGTGLVGSHLLYKLVNANKPVRAIYRDENKLETVKKVFAYYTNNVTNIYSKIEWLQVDILDIPALTEAFKGVTKVYHCAAFISFNLKDYYELRKINIEGTANVVNLCIAASVEKLCYVSSIATLGTKPDHSWIDEETHWNPDANNSVYGITKYGAEMEVWRATQEGLPVVIVNPGIIIGAGFWQTGSGKLFAKIYKGFPYYTTGTTGFVCVGDVVLAMVLLMESNVVNERFILVSENLSFKQIAAIVSKYLKVKAPNKKATKWRLGFAWRLDWLSSIVLNRPRNFSKQQAKTALNISNYSSKKMEQEMGFSFQPITTSIEQVATHFLNEN